MDHGHGAGQPDFRDLIDRDPAVLAGPGADGSAVAHAALAAVKGAALAALELSGGTLDPAGRAEILRLALAMLRA
jgi:hypothetical protein